MPELAKPPGAAQPESRPRLDVIKIEVVKAAIGVFRLPFFTKMFSDMTTSHIPLDNPLGKPGDPIPEEMIDSILYPNRPPTKNVTPNSPAEIGQVKSS